MTPVIDRKEREFERREGEILAAALSLFNRDDWQSVTIDQIAAKAEIGKGTVYKHFESKDQIYAKLVLDFHRGMIAEISQIDRTRPPLEVLSRTLDIFWRGHNGKSEYKRLVRYCRREDFHALIGPKLSKELEQLDEEIMGLLVPVFERGIREGVILDKPVPALILGVHAAMVGLTEMEGVECMETGMTREEQYQEVKEFALRGISRR